MKFRLGIMRLGESYGHEQLDAACRRALSLNTLSYRRVESILRNRLDRNRPGSPSCRMIIVICADPPITLIPSFP